MFAKKSECFAVSLHGHLLNVNKQEFPKQTSALVSNACIWMPDSQVVQVVHSL